MEYGLDKSMVAFERIELDKSTAAFQSIVGECLDRWDQNVLPYALKCRHCLDQLYALKRRRCLAHYLSLNAYRCNSQIDSCIFASGFILFHWGVDLVFSKRNV